MPSSTPALRLPLGSGARRLVRAALPLGVRKRLAVWAARAGGARGEWWSAELVRDLAERDPNAYHRFLWSHHLAYARGYEPAARFGAGHVHPSRRLLFADLLRVAAARAMEVDSVLEVGCSMGYLLRHLEAAVFPAARVLDGIDIDEYAIARGRSVLAAEGSKVRLATADAARLPGVFGGRRYHLVLCAGVLMYLRQEDAAAAVKAMLGRCDGMLALAGLAHPETDNARLAASTRRDRDATWVHNLDAMVARASGHVAARRWEGARQVNGNTLYFVFAEPAPRGAPVPLPPLDEPDDASPFPAGEALAAGLIGSESSIAAAPPVSSDAAGPAGWTGSAPASPLPALHEGGGQAARGEDGNVSLLSGQSLEVGR
ncbi:MAG TPA: methyltransferase domain-containing protein [Longimicrobium sp.]|nr:methyltransferase domain-containing protein [Longimicrobium sp.]